MVKFKYKVLKKFGIFKTDAGQKRLAKNSDEMSHSSRFKRDTNYVDYIFPKENLEKDDLTEMLVDEGYIELVGKKEA